MLIEFFISNGFCTQTRDTENFIQNGNQAYTRNGFISYFSWLIKYSQPQKTRVSDKFVYLNLSLNFTNSISSLSLPRLSFFNRLLTLLQSNFSFDCLNYFNYFNSLQKYNFNFDIFNILSSSQIKCSFVRQQPNWNWLRCSADFSIVHIHLKVIIK